MIRIRMKLIHHGLGRIKLFLLDGWLFFPDDG